MRCLFAVILFCFAFVSSTFAIEVAISRAVFYLPDPINSTKLNPYTEFYWQVNPATVRYNTNVEKKILARIDVEVLITNDSGKTIKADNYIMQSVPVVSVNDLARLNILELKRYFVTPGRMHFHLKLTDLNDTTNKFAYTDTFTVRTQETGTFFSDIELIDTFYEADIKTPFRKNGIQFIPLCQPFLNSARTNLHYLTELYRASAIKKDEFPVVLKSKITRANSFEDVVGHSRVDTLVDTVHPYVYGSIGVENLKSGNYFLNISITAKGGAQLASRSLFFQRMNTRKIAEPVQDTIASTKSPIQDTGMEKVTVINLEKTFLAKYTFAQIKAINKMILPVVDKDVARAIEGFMKRPDELYMRYLVFNYFSSIDKKHPERPGKEYTERIKEVNKLFSTRGRLGYETERGFMYLRYGAPAVMITEQNEINAQPYEIWQYNSLTDLNGNSATNCFILFYKRNAVDFDYQLLHTNIRGELHNLAWRSYLYPQAEAATNENSKAEFYIGNR
jgi:GWxTD domain-containing protein